VTAVAPGQTAKGSGPRNTFAASIALTVAMLASHAPAENQAAAQVAMRDVAFAPAQVTVHVGDTVVWDNADIVAHTATSNEGGFDVSVLPEGKASAVMTQPGTFNYICRYHPNIKGQIGVKP
jgi:plastocyanin